MKVAVQSPTRLNYCETWASEYHRIMRITNYCIYSIHSLASHTCTSLCKDYVEIKVLSCQIGMKQ